MSDRKLYHFIVNTHAKTGKSKYIWDEFEIILKKENINYICHKTKYAGHGTDIAKEITSSTDDTINLVVCGGDGTINDVLNGIKDLSKVVFGYVPLGSANDYARGIGLRDDPSFVLKRVLRSKNTRQIDIGLIRVGKKNYKRFAISAGAGVDAAVCRHAGKSSLKNILNKVRLGQLTYGMLTISELLKSTNAKARVIDSDGNVKEYSKIIFIAGMNFKFEGGGVPMAPGAKPDDGLISFCIVHGHSKVAALSKFPLLLAGKHVGLKGFDIVNSKKLTISFDKKMVIHADGEDYGNHNIITIECLKDALCIPDIK